MKILSGTSKPVMSLFVLDIMLFSKEVGDSTSKMEMSCPFFLFSKICIVFSTDLSFAGHVISDVKQYRC